MDNVQICPSCGKPVAPGAPQGLCPGCLLKSGFETRAGNEPAAGKSGFEPPPVEQMAKFFPQLEIIELLGRGGMGAVYKARQPRLNRFVALKILSPEKQNNPHFAERFEREARAMAWLSHPNIVAVHDFGGVPGMYYLLMEFVDGMSLRQLLQRRRLAPGEALALVTQICQALQFAHEQGVIHRDVKPENILLDKNGQVKIADFGIAKILDLGPEDLSLTGAKDVVGTPHYMAPEQLEKPQTVDRRADIYSLGVVFYEMLTGELPLGKFQPPSQKVEIDVRLDEVVLHALEKEPDRRYQKASDVKTDVETIAGGAPQPANTDYPPSPVEISTGSRLPAVLGVLVVIALFLGIAVAVRLTRNHQSAQPTVQTTNAQPAQTVPPAITAVPAQESHANAHEAPSSPLQPATVYVGNSLNVPGGHVDHSSPLVILGEYDAAGPLALSARSLPTGTIKDVKFYGKDYDFTLYALYPLNYQYNPNEQTFKVVAAEHFSGSAPRVENQTLMVSGFSVTAGDLLAFVGHGPYFPWNPDDALYSDATYENSSDPGTGNARPLGMPGTIFTVGAHTDEKATYKYVRDLHGRQGRSYRFGVDVLPATIYAGNSLSVPNGDVDHGFPLVILGEYSHTGPLAGSSINLHTGMLKDVKFYGQNYDFTLYALVHAQPGPNTNEQKFRVVAAEHFSGSAPGPGVQTLPVSAFPVRNGELLAFAGRGPWFPQGPNDSLNSDATYEDSTNPGLFSAIPPGGPGAIFSVGIHRDTNATYGYIHDNERYQGRTYGIGVDIMP